MNKPIWLAILLITLSSLTLADQHRSSSNIARDQFRHPIETLTFFGVKPHHTVVEIWPGGGWYTEILSPLLNKQGQLYAAHFDPKSDVPFFRNMRAKFESKVSDNAPHYSNIKITTFQPPSKVEIAPKASADFVLTFRNVHNWMRNDSEQASFNAFFAALKPGGILGVVEHRAPNSFNLQKMVDSGYVSEWYVKELAKKAGFEFIAGSEVNANPKDHKDHPKGVWTLPPSLRLGEKDREKYLALGESDRMTLKFKKPE